MTEIEPRKWEPKIKYNGDNIIQIDGRDSRTLDYYIGLGYEVLASLGESMDYIYLKKNLKTSGHPPECECCMRD